jgi:membrane protein DedA with SNARE-associated domain
MLPPDTSKHGLALGLGIILAAFISEDGAIFAAATLAANMALDFSSALLFAFLGLWISDLGVYAAVRAAREHVVEDSSLGRWLSRKFVFEHPQTHKTRDRFGLALSRFFPGTRFPAYVAAGMLRMPPIEFSAITALSAAVWTVLIFAGVHQFPANAHNIQQVLVGAGLAGVTAYLVVKVLRTRMARTFADLRNIIRKYCRWEFWPGWMFYPPVGLMCAWLALRFRGLSVPTIANPGQLNGGIVGESKIEILRSLMQTSPEFIADAYSINEGPLSARLNAIEWLCAQHQINFPFVLKPNTAQRGAGFRKIKSWGEAGAYLAQVQNTVVLQRYVEGPREAGIFYYRFPGEEHGRIFSITEKIFPNLVGDGKRTVEQLLRSDERASMIAATYLARFSHETERILRVGEHLRLVEAGNHCQGCIFVNGEHLNTEQLRAAIDGIARKLPGFFIGRFDVRYKEDKELRNGTGFMVLELNGAASEATDIYDARNTLWSAYRKLYRQWELVYAIGAANRQRGFHPASPFDVWREWRQFQRQAVYYPLAD